MCVASSDPIRVSEAFGRLSRRRLPVPETSPAFDRLVRMATDLLDAPLGVVTIIEPEFDRQVFKSLHGSIDSGLASSLKARETPLSHSICRFVAESDAPISITDAAEDKIYRDHPAHVELGVRAYLGCPIHMPDGRAIGAICVVDNEPRNWDAEAETRLRAIAGCVDDAIRLASALEAAGIAARTAARAEAARDLFFVGMNHEILTELNGVVGLAGLLEETGIEKDMREIARAIGGCATRLHRLLRPVLDVAERVQEEPGAIGPQSVQDVFADVMEIMRWASGCVDDKAALDIAGDLPPLDASSAGHLRLMFYELLSDAVASDSSAVIHVSLSGLPSLRLFVRAGLLQGSEGVIVSTEPVRDFRRIRILASGTGGTFREWRDTDGFAGFEVELPLATRLGTSAQAPRGKAA